MKSLFHLPEQRGGTGDSRNPQRMSYFQMYMRSTGKPYSKGLHIAAIFEGAKGLLVLLVGFELLTFIHKDIHEAAMRLVEQLHFNPASHYPRIFLDAMEHVNDTNLWSMAIAAAMYTVVRMIEAVGLWLSKTWAEWFAILSTGMYIPVEIFEIGRGLSWPKITALVILLKSISERIRRPLKPFWLSALR